MKRILFIAFFLSIATMAWSQQPGSAADSVLRIKRNPDYIADWCTLASENEAIQTAKKGVMREVNQYLKDNQFKYINDTLSFPAHLVKTFSYYMQEANRYRVIAYVSKAELADAENALAEHFRSDDLKTFLSKLADAKNLDEVLTLLDEYEKKDLFLWGYLNGETPLEYQAYMDNGYFVFYNAATKAISDMLTPQDPSSGQRNSLLTGKNADPLLNEDEVLWIYLKKPTE